MTPEMWFAFVILPVVLSIGAWIALKVQQRWLDREIERERIEAEHSASR
ncbi:MAG: hypothetical protein AVDCRST_MAG90-2341 [uncultured Microvirga sp.]|uniref:Uncharacterized protein n=1 Tax=uncultured Microvirga sp. TaxID=412392 RepID=A0A6J4M2Z5_9HYPH|nr:MAG: hypothetical protein AVDCRST_MAG90-2341 [uncultured Microvirga sp.]